MASLRSPSRGRIQRVKKGSHRLSNLARVRAVWKSCPSAILSTSICAWVDEERARLARSQAVRRRRRAFALLVISSLVFFLNSATHQSTIALSKSSPPRCVSPAVAFTSKIPSSSVNTDKSCVPPPQSKMSTFCSPPVFLSRPYAIAAAVGSLIIRSTLRPAMRPASFVAWRCESLKYAGTVTTASVTFSPRYASAVAFIFCRTAAEISSGVKVLDSPPTVTSIRGLSPVPALTLKGQCVMSDFTDESAILRPIRRLASKTVFAGLAAACDLAASPMRRSSDVKAT